MRVLVLRPDDEGKRTAARLAALGHEAISSPVMETMATNAPAPAGVFDAVIATSAQAFRFIDAGALAPFLRLPLLCVGARTAQAARKTGFGDIVIEAPDAAALAESIASQSSARRLLYLAGRDRKPDLEQALAAANFMIAPWVVYEARALEALREEAILSLRAGKVDAVLHFSRRSAVIFCACIVKAALQDEARALLHVAISADAAKGLQQLAPARVRIAAAPDEAHMLDELG
ncbi:MAG: uroporphyrinogen-III synthase [Beijerinckiaceae bacterium]|nr:uroporphyrinogen-III synthase [Beijerinckiaceae bacterium]